jgi:NADPH:quinone reductase-like Zn-dependent oxidoreductase
MNAVIHREYGEPDVLTLGEVGTPVAGVDDVLIRVMAAGVSVGDYHVVTGKPYLLRFSPFGGFPRPRHIVPGAAMSGRIAAVGANVTGFRVGDAVLGQAPHGVFAEYLVLPAKRVARKPENLRFEEAAAVPWGTTALQGLRDAGSLKAGERVLVTGASGAVGTWAVQIAKALGACVSAVCSTRNIDLVRSLGADEVIDYTKADILNGSARYDVFIDMVGNRALTDCKRVLRVGGRYVPCSAGGGDWLGPVVRIIGGRCLFAFGARHMKMFVQKLNAPDLAAMCEWIESGSIKPVVERVWSFSEVGAALRHVGNGHSRGVNVMRIADPEQP